MHCAHLKVLTQTPQAFTATPWTRLSQLFFRTNLAVWSPRPRHPSHTSPTLQMLEPMPMVSGGGHFKSSLGLNEVTAWVT